MNTLDLYLREIVRQELNLFYEQLKELLESNQQIQNVDSVLNFNQACEFLDCSKSYLYKQTSANKIPHSKRGKRIFFSKEKLQKWLTENTVKTRDEIAEDAQSILLNLKSNK